MGAEVLNYTLLLLGMQNDMATLKKFPYFLFSHNLEILQVCFQTTTVKLNMAIKQVKQVSWFPSTDKSSVYFVV